MRGNRFAIVGGRATRKTMTKTSGAAAVAMTKYYFGSNQRDDFIVGHVAKAFADGFGVAPKDLFIDHGEFASASDRRSSGTYGVASPFVTFGSGWNFDTSTPTSETRAFNSTANASMTFSCYNVPSLTFTIQKDYGWGKADVFVNNVNMGLLDSHDAAGGGFLTTVTIPVNASGNDPISVRVTSRTTAPIVLVKVKLDTDSESLGATWNLIPNNMDHKEPTSASTTQVTVGGSSAASVVELGAADAFVTAGRLNAADATAPVGANDANNAYFIKACVEEASAIDTVVRTRRLTNRTRTEALSAKATQTGAKMHLRNVEEVAFANFKTSKTTWRWIEELLHATTDSVNCTANMSVATAENVAAVDTSNRGLRHSLSGEEGATAGHSDWSLIVDAVFEMSPATTADAVVFESAPLGVIEMAFAVESRDCVANLRVKMTEAAAATASEPVRMDAFVNMIAAAVAEVSPATQISGPSQILSIANPFLTSLPAVFRVASVRVVNGNEKESDPTKRVWGRIERSAKSNSPGDLFRVSGQRLYPGSDFANHIMPY